jgi:hypothetical protein
MSYLHLFNHEVNPLSWNQISGNTLRPPLAKPTGPSHNRITPDPDLTCELKFSPRLTSIYVFEVRRFTLPRSGMSSSRRYHLSFNPWPSSCRKAR